MKIYTSNFENIPFFPDSLVPIAICLKTPPEYDGLRLMELAPSHDILYQYKSIRNTDLYTKRFYAEILNRLDSAEIYRQIETLSGKKDCVLLCYEEKSEFCHRHLVAEWLNRTLGIEVQEYGLM